MKNYHRIDVPGDVRYISEWPNYIIPEGKCIVDKKLCGCGYTHFCLVNEENVILCSPRVSLLENKSEQNSGCFYFKSIKVKTKTKRDFGLDTPQKIADYILSVQKDQVFEYLKECTKKQRPLKLLVTYDSLGKLLSILIGFGLDLNNFKVIIDEFQIIFSDSRFKADVELDFVNILDRVCVNTCFLSSTPMLREYLDALPEFEKLDYYEFFWDNHRVIKPNITKIQSENLETSILELINLYREGKGPTKIVDGVEYKSTEAVFYVSNVSMITSIIKKSGLKPEEVNIICSDLGGVNEAKLKKCGKEFKIGKAPLKGERHKMFTFCTSTAFCGVDFYSTNAKSYVFSNCNVETMSIDISLELPQIIGRERLPENVFRYDIVFYYQSSIKKTTKEEFESGMEKKKKTTQEIIDDFEDVLLRGSVNSINRQREYIRDAIDKYNYSRDFCGIDRMTGKPVYNNLVYLSELRAWELQNRIYDDDLTVLMALDGVGSVLDSIDGLDEVISISYFEDRMKKLVEFVEKDPSIINRLPEKYKIYFDNFTVDQLKTSGLRKDSLDKRLKTLKNKITKDNPEIVQRVYQIFSEGKVYLNKEIKSALSGIFKGAKANDILKYFEGVRSRITNKITGKQEEGFRLIKRLY